MSPASDLVQLDSESSHGDSAANTMTDALDTVDRKILAATIFGVHLTEIYSPGGVVREAKEAGLTAGPSMDSTTGWDFTSEDNKKKSWSKSSDRPHTSQ